MTLPIFEKYPALAKHLPWITLANYPTPVEKLQNLGKAVSYDNLWIKRDDKSSDAYGGNKVRKLEFILADAKKQGCKWVVTYGGIGTNHGLATTIHAGRLGLKTALILISQPLTDHVQENLLLDGHYGAEIHYAGNMAIGALQTAAVYLKHGNVYFIPPGGSSTLGSIGYVNAALELKQQIDAGLLPEPKYIFCALGSKGTMTGLLLGCRLAGMKTQVIGVRVAAEWVTRTDDIWKLANRMAGLLRKYDKNVPDLKFSRKDVQVIHEFFGSEYGAVTSAGEQALALMQRTEGIALELTYTAKTVAAMLDCVKKHREPGDAPVLYWHTFNGVDFSKELAGDHDYARLPGDVQWCFNEKLAECLKEK